MYLRIYWLFYAEKVCTLQKKAIITDTYKIRVRQSKVQTVRCERIMFVRKKVISMVAWFWVFVYHIQSGSSVSEEEDFLTIPCFRYFFI